jgi:hypothetical protein
MLPFPLHLQRNLWDKSIKCWVSVVKPTKKRVLPSHLYDAKPVVSPKMDKIKGQNIRKTMI